MFFIYTIIHKFGGVKIFKSLIYVIKNTLKKVILYKYCNLK